MFDGDCNLCNASVNFVLDRDRRRVFLFGTLQSEAGAALLDIYDANRMDLSSVVLLKPGESGQQKVLFESDAILEIARELPSPWPLLAVFRFVPKFIRDPVYRWVARNRYRWFGKRDTCRIPTPETQSRFIDQIPSFAEARSTSE